MTLTFGGSNAYTDFRRTVYTFTINSASKIEELLDLVHEITCCPIFPEKDFESERRVVLSELIMRNTIDFRCTKAMYNLVHGENLLCKRFPIGKVTTQ
jgi:predicted Zn-dependent peptidase